jgi:cobalt-zinc-cadmium efflux system protein
MSEHDHPGHSHDHHSPGAGNNLKVAFFLNLGFTLLEIVGGLLTNSMAILADALHDLGDSFALGMAWGLEKFSKKEKDPTFTYGYQRLSLVGALLNGIILLGGSLFILSKAVPRLMNPEAVHVPGMILFAIVGICANGYAVYKLKSGKSLNERMVSWHLLEDVLGWVAVLIVGIVLLYVDLPILDPILSVLVTLYVLWNVLKNLKRVFLVFLQATPDSFEVSVFEEKVLELPKVVSVHHTHIWSLDGEDHVLSTHVVMEAESTRTEVVQVKSELKKLLHDYSIDHLTVDIEYEGETCVAEGADTSLP